MIRKGSSAYLRNNNEKSLAEAKAAAEGGKKACEREEARTKVEE